MAVEVMILKCVGVLLIHLEFGRTILQPADVYVQDRQVLLAIVLALCHHCELNFGILLVQKVGEAGDVFLFDHFYHIIYVPISVCTCRFDVQRTQTKSITRLLG